MGQSANPNSYQTSICCSKNSTINYMLLQKLDSQLD